MAEILNFEKPEDVNLEMYKKEMGASVVQLLFISNARTIAAAFAMNPDILISDFIACPREPRILFWNQIGMMMESVKALYGLTAEECNQVVAYTIAELLALPLKGGE